MSAELNWSDAVAYFGDDIDPHRLPLSTAAWTTYGLLACRFLADDSVDVVSGNGEHAEQKLMRSPLWTERLDAALARWDPRDAPMLILLALNRSPCSDCAHHLAAALNRLGKKYALRTERQRFVLASLGYYHSNKEEPRVPGAPSRTFTTGRGMNLLREAGWKLCTLSFDGKLTRRGRQLDGYLARMS